MRLGGVERLETESATALYTTGMINCEVTGDNIRSTTPSLNTHVQSALSANYLDPIIVCQRSYLTHPVPPFNLTLAYLIHHVHSSCRLLSFATRLTVPRSPSRTTSHRGLQPSSGYHHQG